MTTSSIIDASSLTTIIGKGDENIIFQHPCNNDKKQNHHVIRVSHKSPSTVRKPRQELARALKEFTPKTFGTVKIISQQQTARKSDKEKEEEKEKEHTAIGLIMENATLLSSDFVFELKPKWGARALVKSCSSVVVVSEEKEGTITIRHDERLLYELPKSYWTESKYFLKQKYKKKIKKENDEEQRVDDELKYNPEDLFRNRKDVQKVFESIVNCYHDQLNDQSRNNFSLTMTNKKTKQSTSTYDENLIMKLFQAGAKAIVESNILDTIFEFQRFGEEKNKSDNNIIIPVLEAPMMHYLMTHREEVIGKKLKFELESSNDDEDSDDNSTVIDCWTEDEEKRMIEKLYNATAARDLSIVVSGRRRTSDSDDDDEIMTMIKVSVIDLDDKSEYRSVEEIMKRDEKVYSLVDDV